MPEIICPFDPPKRVWETEHRYYERYAGRIEHWEWKSTRPRQWLLIKIMNTNNNDEMEYAE